MTHPLDCPIFHEFDGQCCGDDEPCLCRPEPDPIVRPVILNRHFWLLVAAILAPVLLGGALVVDKNLPLTVREQKENIGKYSHTEERPMNTKSAFTLQRIAAIAGSQAHPRIALAQIKRLAEAEIDDAALPGVRIRLDPALPPDTAEIRTPDGKLLWRLP